VGAGFFKVCGLFFMGRVLMQFESTRYAVVWILILTAASAGGQRCSMNLRNRLNDKPSTGLKRLCENVALNAKGVSKFSPG
jgi:hypothetical protein